MSSVTGLSSTYLAIIQDIMEVERQPLTRLTEKKDTITLQKAVMSDLKKMVDDLLTASKTMKSTDVSYAMQSGRSVQITGRADGLDVLAATAASGAVPGAYNITITDLAREHRVRSDRQAYANQDMGLEGTFRIGGANARSLTTAATVADTVTAFGVADPATGQTELGSGSYYVETRQSGGSWQFRVVNSDGKAVSIKKSTTSEYTDGWQSIPSGGGSFDTGRGLAITFGADPDLYTATNKGNGAAQLNYTAQGALIEVAADDSLIDVAYAINHAKYADGNEVVATVVDNHLVLSAKSTGANRLIAASDVTGNVLAGLGVLSGGSFKNSMQAPSSASFTVNGMSVVRSSNTNLTDVISGVTLNLKSDAKNQSATVNVTADAASERSLVDDFVKKFNTLQTYLGEKVATTKNADGTYKRGVLAGDSMFSSLRRDMFRTINNSTTNTGTLRRLSEIGLELDANLKLTVKDSSKLESQLMTNRDNVVALVDAVMAQMETQLGRFTGTSGYTTKVGKTLENELEGTQDQISQMNTRLLAREEALRSQYAAVQTQISYMYNQQSMLEALTGYSTSG